MLQRFAADKADPTGFSTEGARGLSLTLTGVTCEPTTFPEYQETGQKGNSVHKIHKTLGDVCVSLNDWIYFELLMKETDTIEN